MAPDLLAWGAALLVAAWLLGRAWPVGGPWYTATMTRQPLRVTPAMIQPRGEPPPDHGPGPDDPARHQQTAQTARLLSLARLAAARHVRDRRRDDGGRV